MYIIVNDMSSLLHLPIGGRLLDHSRMIRLDTLEMMVTYLGDYPEGALKELEDTRGCHVRFGFFGEPVYTPCGCSSRGQDDAQVMHHRACSLRSYLMYLVCLSIFIYKNAYYSDVVYNKYFIYFDRIHEYN